MVNEIYEAINRRLWPAAARQVLAYLIALQRENRITATPTGRELTPEEKALLDPDWRAAVRPEDAEVIRAELGFGNGPQQLIEYALL